MIRTLGMWTMWIRRCVHVGGVCGSARGVEGSLLVSRQLVEYTRRYVAFSSEELLGVQIVIDSMRRSIKATSTTIAMLITASPTVPEPGIPESETSQIASHFVVLLPPHLDVFGNDGEEYSFGCKLVRWQCDLSSLRPHIKR